MHVLDMLKERGFIAQVTFEEDLYKALEREPMTFYVALTPRRTACMWATTSPSWPWRICSAPGTGLSPCAAAAPP